MRIFNSIKKSRRESSDIDEKIEYLNKELEKTGLREAMTTSNMYVSGGRVPNEDYVNFNGLSHGGYGLGLSGADGNSLGGASVGDHPSIEGLTGVALSPPHPVTGVRRVASHVTDGIGSNTPLRPGVTIARGFGDNPNYITMGSAVWFWDSNYNFGGQQGRWLNFEYFDGGLGFWDTNFLGFFFHNKNLDEFELSGANIGTQIKNKIAGINFGDNGSVGTPETLVLTKNDLDDPGFLPINIDGLSTQGFNYLKGKAGVDVSSSDDAARSAYFKAGGKMAWSYLDPKQKEYWRNKVGKGIDSLESQPEVPGDPSESQPKVPGDPPVYVDASKITSADILDEFEDEKPSAKGVKLTKWISRMDFMKKYPDSSMGEYLDALPYGATDFMTRNPNYNDAWDVNLKGFEDYFLKGDLSALGNNKGTPKPRHSEATPDPEPTKKSSIFTDAITKLGNFATDPLQAVADFFGNYLTPPAAEYSTNIAKSVAVNKPITVKQEDIPKGDINKFFKNFGYQQPLPFSYGKPTPYADDNFYADEKGNIKSNIGPNGEKGFYKKNNTADMGGGKGIAGYGNPLAAAGQAQAQFVEPDDGSEPYFLYTDHAYHNLTSDDKGEVPDKVKATLSSALHALTGKSDATKPNTGAMSGYPPNIKGDVKTEFKIPYSKLPQNIKNRVDFERRYKELVKAGKVKNIDDPYQPESFNVSQKKPDGKLLSEAAKLGHFEPASLTVDIEDLRKGIMPEFPKDPPPEMVDGYNPKSRLAPKKLERSSFIKITKKDLAKNHRLKDSEIKDFMDTINAINEFIKKHPEELIYAQTRYPKNDPRLAQLNWEMDQKLNASKEYMDKHYPENQKLFTKVQKSIKKNIELTDPKSFKGVKVPKFKGVDLTDYKRRKEVVSRHYKKAVKIKSLFGRKKT